MKKLLQEFKDFAVKGNAIDLAVAVVIGGAFGKIVSSLVSDIIMPLVGLVTGGGSLTQWKITLKAATETTPETILNAGVFLQNIVDFLIIAWAIFLVIKLMNRLKTGLKKEKDKEPVEEGPKPLTKDQELLTEIRNLLQEKK